MPAVANSNLRQTNSGYVADNHDYDRVRVRYLRSNQHIPTDWLSGGVLPAFLLTHAAPLKGL